MPRRRKRRRCAIQPPVLWFHPAPPGPVWPEPVELGLDELEAMRLVDFLRKDQSTAGAEMGISRGTVQRLLYSGRRKVVQALLEGRPIRILAGRATRFRCTSCGHEWGASGLEWAYHYQNQSCPRCGSPLVQPIP